MTTSPNRKFSYPLVEKNVNGLVSEQVEISPNASDIAYNHILQLILSGDLKVGERLPSEEHLALTLKISRPMVREALARLREDGLLVSRKGSGSYVRSRPAPAVSAFAPLESIADIQRCFEFRIGLEGEAAYKAACNRTEEDLVLLTQSFNALSEPISADNLGVVEDLAFHRAVALATHNRFYQETLEHLSESIATGMTLTRTLTLRRAVHSQVFDEHRAILEAIRLQQPDAARQAARLHVENARQRVFHGADMA